MASRLLDFLKRGWPPRRPASLFDPNAESLGRGLELEASSYREVHQSPDGRVRVEFGLDEAKMSHWIYELLIREVSSGEAVFVPDGRWDGIEFDFLASGQIRMKLRQYPGRRRPVEAVFDPRDWTVPHNLCRYEGGRRTTSEPAESFAAKLSAVPPAD